MVDIWTGTASGAHPFSIADHQDQGRIRIRTTMTVITRPPLLGKSRSPDRSDA